MAIARSGFGHCGGGAELRRGILFNAERQSAEYAERDLATKATKDTKSHSEVETSRLSMTLNSQPLTVLSKPATLFACVGRRNLIHCAAFHLKGWKALVVEHVVAMNSRNPTVMHSAVRILAIAYVVIAVGLIYWGLLWMGSRMGPPRWVPDTEAFIKTNHVEGVECPVRQLIHGESLCRSDIDMLLALDYVPIKCLLLSSSWLDLDSKLAIYKSSSISEKRELYTALSREEQDSVDVLEGRWITHVLHKVGRIGGWILGDP